MMMEFHPVLRWRFNDNGAVQVERFPEHHVTRCHQDWGWRMENDFVAFVSQPGPPANTHPLQNALVVSVFPSKSFAMSSENRQGILLDSLSDIR